MGQNLVLNVESRGFKVSVYNRTTAVTEEFVAEHPGKKLVGAKTLEEFVDSLERPRKIMIMVKAGGPVDAVIESLIPLLDKGDIIIDGGNSLYTDTERRDATCRRTASASSAPASPAARRAPARGRRSCPAARLSTWEVMKPIFESIAAKVDGEPCVIHIGPGGAGHYVKMIHNGIEYGDMQLICEAYNIFKAAGFTTEEMADVFNEWNDGDLESYLIQITGKIFEQKDPEDRQADRRPDPRHGRPEGHRQVDAHERGRKRRRHLHHQRRRRGPHPFLDEGRSASPRARCLKARSPSIDGAKTELVKKVHDALYASKIISYAQGLDLITTMGEKKGWDLDLGRIAAIWRGGCIIRARFLNRITEAYRANPALANLMLAPFFKDLLNRLQQNWREVVALAIAQRHPGARVQRVARLLRQLSRGAAAGQPAAGAARLLRRPHLRAHRQAGRRDVPHRLAGGHRSIPADADAALLRHVRPPGESKAGGEVQSGGRRRGHGRAGHSGGGGRTPGQGGAGRAGLMGGDCLNVGCVPSKALLAAAAERHQRGGGPEFSEVMARVRAVRAAIAPHDSAARFRELGGRRVFWRREVCGSGRDRGGGCAAAVCQSGDCHRGAGASTGGAGCRRGPAARTEPVGF